MTFDHATGLCGGVAVASGVNDPDPASFSKFGIFPAAIRSRHKRGSMPSKPSTSKRESRSLAACREMDAMAARRMKILNPNMMRGTYGEKLKNLNVIR